MRRCEPVPKTALLSVTANAGWCFSDGAPAPPIAFERGPERLENESILERIAAGDPRAVDDCLTRYGSLVWSLARRLGVPTADTEDAVQDAFVAIWQAAAKFDATIAPEPAFVATIARRRIVDRRRAAERRGVSAALEDVAEPAAAPERLDRAEFDDEAARIQRAFSTLEPERRRVLELAVVKGLSHDGIAKLLKLPLGTVKSHTRRGLAAVRRLLGVESYEEDAP